MIVHKKITRAAALLLALSLCLTLQPAAFAASTGFSDVGKSDWFYTYVTDLTAAGVIDGYPNGSFQPGGAVTTGEALKLVLLAAGYSEQSATGSHWASGYASLATSIGLLSSSEVSSLDGAMTRQTVAKLAARALGLTPSAAPTPFTDATNGLATALYEKGILTGSPSGNGLLLAPKDNIIRSQISAIVWRIRSYKSQSTAKTFTFAGRSIEALSGLAVNSYDSAAFSTDANGVMSYTGSGVSTRRGIDVSQWQGSIDWAKVKAAGIDFAILRVGGRYLGKNNSGIYDDTTFAQNIQGATAAGIDVGVYFFSTAVTANEAAEEADFVLSRIKGYSLKMPVVFDWEANSSEYRNYGLDAYYLNACANTFTARVKAAGYTPMVYFNDSTGYFGYDLSRLSDCPHWLAEYHVTTANVPTFYYDFAIWQYSDKGAVDGISGNVDLDIQFVK